MSTPEGKIQKEILNWLRSQGIFAWRNNNVPIWDKRLNSGYGGYRSLAGIPGVPDIIAIVSGRFVGLEVKPPQGKQSADQVLFERMCKRAGGFYAVVRSVEQAKTAIEAASAVGLSVS